MTTSPSFQQTDRDSLRDALRAVVRSWWIVLLCGIVAAGAAFAYGDHDETTYSASATLSFSQNLNSTAIGVGAGLVDAPRTLQNAAQTISLPVIGERVVQRLGPQVTAGAGISTNFSSKSDILSITVTSPKRSAVAAVANETAQAYLDYRNEIITRQAAPVRRLLTKQAHAATAAGVRQAILQKRDTLDALTTVQNQQAVLLQRAVEPAGSTPGNTKRNTLIALLLGLVVGVAIGLLRGLPTHETQPT